MIDKEKIKSFVEGQLKENYQKRHNGSGGSFYYAKAEEDKKILDYINSL